jgi:hypothetical protein
LKFFAHHVFRSANSLSPISFDSTLVSRIDSATVADTRLDLVFLPESIVFIPGDDFLAHAMSELWTLTQVKNWRNGTRVVRLGQAKRLSGVYPGSHGLVREVQRNDRKSGYG